MKRFSLKNLIELPDLILLEEDIKDDDDDEEEYDYIGPGFIRDISKFVLSINELLSGKIMIVLRFQINIYNPNIEINNSLP